MRRKYSGVILGYHGCDESIVEAIVGGDYMRPSEKDYDWLGHGAYFWENDPERAQEWAIERAARAGFKRPAVLGAIIDPGNCLDLTVRSDLALLAESYKSLKATFAVSGEKMPENKDMAGGARSHKPLRYLDCAVIQHLCGTIEKAAAEALAEGKSPPIEPFDSVRGLFLEGDSLYPGGGFYTHTHAQIAVRNPDCIIGFFKPR